MVIATICSKCEIISCSNGFKFLVVLKKCNLNNLTLFVARHYFEFYFRCFIKITIRKTCKRRKMLAPWKLHWNIICRFKKLRCHQNRHTNNWCNTTKISAHSSIKSVTMIRMISIPRPRHHVQPIKAYCLLYDKHHMISQSSPWIDKVITEQSTIKQSATYTIDISLILIWCTFLHICWSIFRVFLFYISTEIHIST